MTMLTLNEFRSEHKDRGREGFLALFPEPFLIVQVMGTLESVKALPDRSEGHRLTIGSGPECDVQLPDDELGKAHLEVFYHPVLRSWCLSDLGHESGTLLDGRPMVPLAVLSLNDASTAYMGRSNLRLCSAKRLYKLAFGTTTQRHSTENLDRPRLTNTPPLKGPRLNNMQATKLANELVDGSSSALSVWSERMMRKGRDRFLEDYPHPLIMLATLWPKSRNKPTYLAQDLPHGERLLWSAELRGDVPVFVVGRDPLCNLRLLARVVSKKHAIIRPKDHRSSDWIIEDLGSTNQTFINGQALEPYSPCDLSPGSLINISPDIALYFTSAERAYTDLNRPQVPVRESKIGHPTKPSSRRLDSPLSRATSDRQDPPHAPL